MQANQVWFPAADTASSRIVGRFVDLEDTYTDRDGIQQTRVVTILEHKVPGSNDISASAVKPFNKAELVKRFPQAWDLYEKTKAVAPAAPPEPTATQFGIKGTPIEELSFLGKNNVAYLKSMGFMVVEQIRDMSDTDCNNVGFGSKSWRKKAAEHLASVAANARG